MSTDEPDYSLFGKRVRQARNEKGWTQQRLAEQTGLSRQTISGYENGNGHPSSINISKIAEALDISEDRLSSALQTGVVSDGDPPYEADQTLEIQIFQDVRPAAGNGNVIYEAEERNPDTLIQSKWLFEQILGFWPPDDMRGTYIDGDSMSTVEGPYDDGQLILYRPVEELTSGERFLLLVEDVSTGDWRLLFKKVQVYAGGGIKIISDNKAAGLEDETLLPNDEGKLVHQTTGLPVQMRVVGRVLWPDPDQAANEVTVITRTIERLVNMGMISS